MKITEVIKKIIKAFIPYGIIWAYNKYKAYKYKDKTTKEIFTEIKKKNYWGSTESVSGSGSVLKQTQSLITELPKILKEKCIKTFLDIPCGDFNWMKELDLSSIHYIGADIVDEIINENKKKYETNNIKFVVMDIIKDTLPMSDIIFVRDCFVHLSFENILKAIENIKKSGSKYLLTTTFTDRIKNIDIVTGDWRPINLEIMPFLFPKPEKIIIENCTEGDGEYKDKSMGLWNIKKL